LILRFWGYEERQGTRETKAFCALRDRGGPTADHIVQQFDPISTDDEGK
jgi:hypothetical protein